MQVANQSATATYESMRRNTFLLPLRPPFLLWVLPCLSASPTFSFSSIPRSKPAPKDSMPFLRGLLLDVSLFSLSSRELEDADGTQLISMGVSSVSACVFLPAAFLAEPPADTGARRCPNVAALSPNVCPEPLALARRGAILTLACFLLAQDWRLASFWR